MLIILKLPYPQLQVSLIDAYCNSICMLILLAACRRRVLFFVLFYSVVFRRWYTSIDYCSSSMRCHVLSFATIYRGSISLFVAYGCGEIIGRSVLLDISTPTRSFLNHITWRGIIGPSLMWTTSFLFWFLFMLLLTISIFTLPPLFTYSRLLPFLHTRIPTLLELTLKSICLIKNKSLNFPESRRNKKMLKTTRGLMMVS